MYNEHTTQNEYTEAGIQLSNALHKLINEYKGTAEESGVKSNKDGSYEIFISDGDTKPVEFWFQNEVELGSWILAMNREN